MGRLRAAFEGRSRRCRLPAERCRIVDHGWYAGFLQLSDDIVLIPGLSRILYPYVANLTGIIFINLRRYLTMDNAQIGQNWHVSGIGPSKNHDSVKSLIL